MSNFIKDTLVIDENLNVSLDDTKRESLHAAILPYYIHPESMELMVVMKRSILPGGYARTGRKMGITALTVELPEDNPLTLEQVYEKLNLDAQLQEAIPYGGVMPSPETSDLAYELVLAHTEPFELIDEKRSIIYQEKGKYEIGAIKFNDVLEGVQQNIVHDLKTRQLLTELYIMALDEKNKDQNPNNMMTGSSDLIGGGNNLPDGFGSEEDIVKTGNMSDEVIEKNSQLDYGSIYSQVQPGGDFSTVINKSKPE